MRCVRLAAVAACSIMMLAAVPATAQAYLDDFSDVLYTLRDSTTKDINGKPVSGMMVSLTQRPVYCGFTFVDDNYENNATVLFGQTRNYNTWTEDKAGKRWAIALKDGRMLTFRFANTADYDKVIKAATRLAHEHCANESPTK